MLESVYVTGKTRLQAIINRLRNRLREHRGCSCCQGNYGWLTAISYLHTDDAHILFTALLALRDAYKHAAPGCRCCRLGHARVTAELFTYGQNNRVVSAA